MNIRKLCIRLLTIITLSCALFCVNFFISWSGNVAFESMMRATLPFIALASVCWLVYGIAADGIYKENVKKHKAVKRSTTVKKNNVIYLDSLISLGYYKKAC